MDFYNKNFYRMICHVDPDGMLNVPVNVYTDRNCLDRYFRTNNDFQKLNVPWMCDQLIILMSNFKDIVAITSNLTFLQNDFQRIKYSFILISQAFIGLVLIQENSIKAYYSYCKNSMMALYKVKPTLNKEIRKKKKKKKINTSNQTGEEKIIQNQQIESLCQNKVITSGFETNLNEIDSLLNNPRQTAEMNIPEIIVTDQIIPNIPMQCNQIVMSNLNNDEIISDTYRKSNLEDQPIEEFQISNQIQLFPKNETEQQLIEQPQNIINLQNIPAEPLIEQEPKNLPEEPNQLIIEKHSSQNNQQLKRKRSENKIKKRNFKKRPIEQSNKILKTRLKKLEGPLPDRPLECIAMKYIQQSMNHLPLRHAMYHSKLNISFAAITLNMELEENKNQDDIFNNELTMNSYKALTEKLNYSNISNCCIYQQCINNALPHLSLLPVPEEYLTNNSLVWRDTINEINKKMEDSLKDILSISKTDQNKWEDFKEKMKQKVNQSLVANKTLMGPELSHVYEPEPLILLPSSHQIDELLNENSIIENHNSINGIEVNTNNVCHIPSLITEVGLPTSLPSEEILCNSINIDQKNCVINQLHNIQNVVEPAISVCHKQSIDIMQMIFKSLQKFPKNTSILMFTDLCPTHVTIRKYAILVLAELLELHKKGIVKLCQPCNMTEPSSISIELNIDSF